MSRMTIHSTIQNRNTSRLATNDGLHFRNSRERAQNTTMESTMKDVEAMKAKNVTSKTNGLKRWTGTQVCPPEKTRPDPSLEAKIERRSNERLCERLKQKPHGNRCVNYSQDKNEEVEYQHARFLTYTDWYQWETKEWYLKEEGHQAEGKFHNGGQGRKM